MKRHQPIVQKCQSRNFAGNRSPSHGVKDSIAARVSASERAWALYFSTPVGSLAALEALARVKERA